MATSTQRAPCVEALFDSSNDIVLADVLDVAGAPITGATVSAEIFDVSDLTTPLLTILSGAFTESPAGTYFAIWTPITGDGFSVGQRVQIVFNFDGPGSDDERIFNVIAIICEG